MKKFKNTDRQIQLVRNRHRERQRGVKEEEREREREKDWKKKHEVIKLKFDLYYTWHCISLLNYTWPIVSPQMR